jgi:hypothetical protein
LLDDELRLLALLATAYEQPVGVQLLAKIERAFFQILEPSLWISKAELLQLIQPRNSESMSKQSWALSTTGSKDESH